MFMHGIKIENLEEELKIINNTIREIFRLVDKLHNGVCAEVKEQQDKVIQLERRIKYLETLVIVPDLTRRP